MIFILIIPVIILIGIIISINDIVNSFYNIPEYDDYDEIDKEINN